MDKIIGKNVENRLCERLLKDNKEFDQKLKNINLRSVFKPFNFNNLKIVNHFCFKNLTDKDFYDKFCQPNVNFIKFYSKIANSGAGIIITGPCNIDKLSNTKKHKNNPLKGENKVINTYLNTTMKVHTFGSKIFLNLSAFYGRGLSLNKYYKMNLSSSFNYSSDGEICLRITDGMCREIIESFTNAAIVANKSNFDGVLIDGTLFNILGEFSSNEFNRRVFGYYSGIETFVNEVVKSVVNKTPTLNVLYSISLDSMIEVVYGKDNKAFKSINNIKYNNSKKSMFLLLKTLVESGVDGFYFEFGTYETEFFKNFNQFERECLFVEIIDEIKSYFRKINLKNKFNNDIIVIVNDNFENPDTIESCINNKKFDMVDVSRDIFADENYIKKLKSKAIIRNCIKCSYCNKVASSIGKIECEINPSLIDFEGIKNVSSINKKVAVVGAGIAGIVCSLKLADRGYIVDLFDKNEAVNKTGRLTELFGFDEMMNRYNNYLENSLFDYVKNKKINLHLKENVEANQLICDEYYSIVVASGFKEKFFNINGAVLKNVKSLYDVLDMNETILTKRNFVVYARSELSLKFAIYLIKMRKNVTILLNSVDFLLKLSNDRFLYYLFMFKKFQAKIYFSFKINVIHEDFVELLINNKIKDENTMRFILNNKNNLHKIKFEGCAKNIDLDYFVYEPEIYPNNKLYYDIVTNGFKREVYLIGNALENTTLGGVIKSGYFVGKNL